MPSPGRGSWRWDASMTRWGTWWPCWRAGHPGRRCGELKLWATYIHLTTAQARSYLILHILHYHYHLLLYYLLSIIIFLNIVIKLMSTYLLSQLDFENITLNIWHFLLNPLHFILFSFSLIWNSRTPQVCPNFHEPAFQNYRLSWEASQFFLVYQYNKGLFINYMTVFLLVFL